MNLLDSRRLTGPNLLLDRPGAVLSVSLSREEAAAAVAAWKEQARRILDAVGWAREEIRARVFPGGASLAITAPIDALYAATEVNELAWAAAEASFPGRAAPAPCSSIGGWRSRSWRPRVAASCGAGWRYRHGEVPAILTQEILRLGAPPESVTRAGSELRAVHEALAWARPGDLLVLLVHTQRAEVLEVLR